ncbi:MAG TPA: HisA/HisF-related TIM barrel protein [Candidatus Omnitrophota bacterium]|nr:HisA/HisF-related TIM barrel protein [Candidatus Omnitrophota bacterium]
MDTVANLYNLNSLFEIVRTTARNVFIPIALDGRIPSIKDVTKLLQARANKAIINTVAIRSLNCYGAQFHPGKSGPVGLGLRRNFLVLSRGGSQ